MLVNLNVLGASDKEERKREREKDIGRVKENPPARSSFATSYQGSLLRVVAFHKSAVGFVGSTSVTTRDHVSLLLAARSKRRLYAAAVKKEKKRKGREGIFKEEDRKSRQ